MRVIPNCLTEMPIAETSSGFVVTLNQMGYMVGHLDKYSEKFCEFSASADHPVLEVGAAYGIATLKALEKGTKKIYANDLDKRHLAILERNCKNNFKSSLVLVPGAFPEEVQLPSNTFSAILISRVLHFFAGEKIQEILKKCYKLLRENGKIFVVCDTVFMKNWRSFVPEYEARVLKGEEWPGLMEDSEKYAEDKHRAQDRQKLVNLFDKAVMENVLKKAGFIIEEIDYIDQKYYPIEMIGNGKESVGAIGIKQA